jgi:hypothetical protein
MKWQLVLAASASLIAASETAVAHHSFAMFDQQHPVVLEGVVQEYHFTNPHSFIVLKVKQENGETLNWNLEGTSPSSLVREGWSSKSIKAGDELKVKMWPLRSGAPGGGWNAENVNFRDGRPVAKPLGESPKEY